MIHRKQSGYDAFKCIADKCPKSCCEGWQIMIDDESIDRYQNESGHFGQRLLESINFAEQCFLQNNSRCAMLNDNGLCDLHSSLGEESLCYTCKMFPRHVEEFQDIREYSLSLACPEYVRMLLDPAYKFSIAENEDDLLDDPEEFEDYDFILFDKLDFARDKMLHIAEDSNRSLQGRLNQIASMALALQECYDLGDIFERDSISSGDDSISWDDSASGVDSASRNDSASGVDSNRTDVPSAIDGFCNKNIKSTLDYSIESMDVLINMEVLEESWRDSIISAQKYWKRNSNDTQICKSAMFPDSNTEFIFQKIFESLLYTYFCGAVYDGQIYARAMIAVQSTRWLMMLYYANHCMDLNSIIYLYSREVEHSDLNVDALIEHFENELIY
ncbi:MAG: flagellin lysine-N-methylase [Lachnospiraceae bacterium]|nr:flagellin lysine-N-methylase [Lachnospiraceae bacterium]